MLFMLLRGLSTHSYQVNNLCQFDSKFRKLVVVGLLKHSSRFRIFKGHLNYMKWCQT